jgi:hypothetical protein
MIKRIHPRQDKPRRGERKPSNNAVCKTGVCLLLSHNFVSWVQITRQPREVCSLARRFNAGMVEHGHQSRRDG